MYKTVRHGENSLQYTILPQQDDAAAITAANNNNICGRISAGVRRRARRGRTATILIMTLILACGVVGAAVVVPLLVSSDLVALPSAFQRFSSNNNGHHHGGHHGHRSAALHTNKTAIARHNTTTVASVGPEPTSAGTTTASTRKLDPTSVSVSPSLLPEEVVTTTKAPVPVTLSLTTEEAESRATTQQQGPAEMEGLLEEEGGAKDHDRVGGSKKKALDEDMRNSTLRSYVFAATDNKNVSAMELTTEADVNQATEQPKHKSWLEIHWPYVYPSSYFQWTVSSFLMFCSHAIYVLKYMSLVSLITSVPQRVAVPGLLDVPPTV